MKLGFAGAYSAMLCLIFLCQASSKKGKTKHLAGMEHPAGPVAFNKIGMNSLARRERKNSKHHGSIQFGIFNLIIFKLAALNNQDLYMMVLYNSIQDVLAMKNNYLLYTSW